mmetsp:Transcript_80291/g.215202  ORF Transcript_80291/g.215202 Transcript_80291/m.215202 type:complete len:85 (+) Transcript_80291:1336-1590(+)
MFGDAVIGPAIGSIAFMPAVVLTSKLVHRGLESTTFALLAGFSNFGGTVSSQIGIFVTKVPPPFSPPGLLVVCPFWELTGVLVF